MMKKLFSLLLIFILNSCSSQESARKDFDIANKCAYESNQLMEKQGFTLSAYGGDYLGTIREINYCYYTKQYCFTDIADARALLIEKVLQFAEPFNNEKQIRMYLHNFPFDLNNIHLSITFRNEENVKLSSPYIASVFNGAGYIFYTQKNPLNEKFVTFHKESIEEGLKLYNEYKSEPQKQKE